MKGEMYKVDEVLTRLTDVTNKFVVCVDMDGNYCYANKAFSRRFGWEIAEVMGRPSLSDIHEDDHDLVRATVGKCCANVNTAYDLVVRKPVKGGGHVHTQWDFIAMPDAQGAPGMILCTGMEITPFVEQDAAHRLQLKEIAHDQSHVVRRPLANILTMAELLGDRSHLSEAEQDELLRHIREEAHRLDAIVRAIVLKSQAPASGMAGVQDVARA